MGSEAVGSDAVAEHARRAGLDVAPSDIALPIDDGAAVLVVGSQAFNDADRSLPRGDVRTIQLLTSGSTIGRSRFDVVGVRGIRDFLPLHDDTHALVTTANDLVIHNLVTRAESTWPVHDLADIHTLTAFGDSVLVASTATDEVHEIGLDGVRRSVTSLAPLRHDGARPIAHDRALGGVVGAAPADAADHFHINEAFISHDGHRLGVVHHVAGYRRMVHATNRLVGHGDGGIVDLDDMRAYDLGLVAPHSARVIGEGYVVLDSGRSTAVRTDRAWTPTATVELPGWGRGFAVSADQRRWFVGISATRRRYLRSGQAAGVNAVTALLDGVVVATRPVHHVEQIWSVHLLSPTFTERLVDAMAG